MSTVLCLLKYDDGAEDLMKSLASRQLVKFGPAVRLRVVTAAHEASFGHVLGDYTCSFVRKGLRPAYLHVLGKAYSCKAPLWCCIVIIIEFHLEMPGINKLNIY